MQILITGGTGFIGSALCPQLLMEGHSLTVLTRHPEKVVHAYGGKVRAIRSLTEFSEDWPLDAVINLAGEGIADRPGVQHASSNCTPAASRSLKS